ncbi:hypothetical protein BD830_101759 [Maritimibacter alkaliphilus HTCC2654]|uniref:hypothetical protein n=1 Tax=Maritimibacter alkaliphilus TaxID=404236 RepID=UPI00031CE325|nr:hypothetical protein [Maritimibacter alkaliphilus]TYP85793.1 hypothetical protein BD830_101759 [Maritimibacter alkaliphilus HTCC2654]
MSGYFNALRRAATGRPGDAAPRVPSRFEGGIDRGGPDGMQFTEEADEDIGPDAPAPPALKTTAAHTVGEAGSQAPPQTFTHEPTDEIAPSVQAAETVAAPVSPQAVETEVVPQEASVPTKPDQNEHWSASTPPMPAAEAEAAPEPESPTESAPAAQDVAKPTEASAPPREEPHAQDEPTPTHETDEGDLFTALLEQLGTLFVPPAAEGVSPAPSPLAEAQAAPEPVIVEIGQIDIRLTDPAAKPGPARTPRPTTHSPVALDDYLETRGRR